MASVVYRRARFLSVVLFVVLCASILVACGGLADDDSGRAAQATSAGAQRADLAGGSEEAAVADAENANSSQPLAVQSD
ncbi:MAG: hypothetical protein IT333_08015, partial [Thermomicrobiales bacterium]|nr:hypothetical protein [Thermomicrobiales bacterium]